MLTHFSLFTGIGGIDLAAEWAGFETVGQCEFADYPVKVLEKHWPKVPRWRDIRDVTADSFRERTGLRTVDIISGGFPCQPFSVAGKQAGKEDERYLWPEMLRVIKELNPRWVLGENVPGILRIAGDTVCQDLEHEGYDVGIFDYEAAAVGAPHRRERIFFLANADGRGRREERKRGRLDGISRERQDQSMPVTESGADVADTQSGGTWRLPFGKGTAVAGFVGGGKNASDTDNQRLQVSGYKPGIETFFEGNGAEYSGCHVSDAHDRRGAMRRNGEFSTAASFERTGCNNGGRTTEYVARERRAVKPGMGGMADGFPAGLDGIITFPPEPDIPRIATGVKNRVNRLKCLGNAVVPAQIYPILKAIAIIELI